MGVVHKSQGILDPCSPGLRSETWIVAKLANTLFGDEHIDWMNLAANYDHIRTAIENTIPGFENYNKRVREPGGFYLPNGARDGKFNTPSGKAHFTINKNHEEDVPNGHYIMMTLRSHDQYNTTIYGLDDRYRGIFNERRIVMMNKHDMHREGFKAKDKVDLIGLHNGVERIAKQFIVVPYDIPQGNVATYFPEANVLVPIDSFARGSKTPASKRVVIRIQM
jgi:anaerobic selenocysteine-containing dehydrogenase